MGEIILGAMVGVLVGLAAGVMWLALNFNNINSERLAVRFAVVTVVFAVIGGGCSGVYTPHVYKRYINQYPVTKATIESSIKNTELGGLERVALVQQAISENKTLVDYQYNCQQWYGFLIPDEMLDLEPIRFSE